MSKSVLVKKTLGERLKEINCAGQSKRHVDWLEENKMDFLEIVRELPKLLCQAAKKSKSFSIYLSPNNDSIDCGGYHLGDPFTQDGSTVRELEKWCLNNGLRKPLVILKYGGGRGCHSEGCQRGMRGFSFEPPKPCVHGEIPCHVLVMIGF